MLITLNTLNVNYIKFILLYELRSFIFEDHVHPVLKNLSRKTLVSPRGVQQEPLPPRALFLP